MIPFKKLLQFTPPEPCEKLGGFKIIRCTAAQRNVGGSVYYEFAYWHVTQDHEPYAAIRVFTDGSDVRIWNAETGKMSGALLRSLWFYGPRGQWYNGALCLDSRDVRLIDETSAETALHELFQTDKILSSTLLQNIQEKRRGKKEAKKQYENIRYKEDVFGLLKDYDLNTFKEFVKDFVMSEHYMFQQPASEKERHGYCTYCEEWIPLSWSYRHKDTARCPKCGRWVSVRDVRRGHKSIYHTGVFMIIERLGDESVVLRTFQTFVDYGSVTEGMLFAPRIKICESTRHIINYNGKNVRYEYLDQYDNYPGYRHEWCRMTAFDGNHGLYDLFRSCYNAYMRQKVEPNGLWLYLPSSSDALKNTRLKYVDFLKIWQSEPAKYLRWNQDGDHVPGALRLNYHDLHLGLMRFFRYPVFEYLYKYGALNLIRLTDPRRYGLNYAGKTVSAVFGGLRTRDVVELLRRDMPAGKIQIAAQIYQRGIEPTAENVDAYFPFLNNNTTVPRIGHLQLLQEYAKKYKYSPVLYGDYLDMCVKLGYDLNDKYVEFPKNLKKAHRDVETQIILKNNKEISAKIEKLEKKTNKIYAYDNGEYLIRAPHDAYDFTEEGKQQHNCVAKMYMEKYAKGSCVILFVRKKSDEDHSYITVEVRDNSIRQYYAKGNSYPDEAGKRFKEEYDAAVLKPLREKERQRA